MLKRVLKKSLTLLGLLIVFTMSYSAVYNQPIRFRPKIMAYANSVYSLNPSQSEPDQIILIPGADSSHSLRLSWRTSKRIKNGEIVFWKQAETEAKALTTKANLSVIESPELRSDQTTHRFSAVLENLEPGRAYSYKVGDPQSGQWSGVHSFTTAPDKKAGFSFVYFGDTQASPDNFGRLLGEVDKQYPETAFYMIAGDLVEDGEWRYMWDALAGDTSPVFANKPVAPALGNHDYHNIGENGVKYFTGDFNTPANGPASMPEGMSYSFEYGDAQFIILDSNYDIQAQTGWLEEQLSQPDRGDYKIVMFHHPPYQPIESRERESVDIQRYWVPLFDKYKVDLVLNGHDHSYLRTKKMKNGTPVSEGQDGTIYLASTACEKYYDYMPLKNAAVQFGRELTYQVISVSDEGPGRSRLTYQAFDREHRLKDSFELQKTERQAHQ